MSAGAFNRKDPTEAERMTVSAAAEFSGDGILDFSTQLCTPGRRRRANAVSKRHNSRHTGDSSSSDAKELPVLSIPIHSRVNRVKSIAASRRRRAETHRTESGVVAFFVSAGVITTSTFIIAFLFGLSLPSADTFRAVSADKFLDAIAVFSGGGHERALEQRALEALRNAKAQYEGWPLSVRDEEFNFELIEHPSDAVDLEGRQVELAVPRFYVLDSLHSSFFDGELMTRRVADSIGSYVSDSARNAGDVDARTIFVSLTSYRNPHCRNTVQNAFAHAAHPERIRVGIVDQIDPSDVPCDVPIMPCSIDPDQILCKFHNQIDVYELQSKLAVGPIFSRHISQRLYRGEYYYLQIDSDVTFVRKWDVDIVYQFESAGNEMAVITTYLLDVTDEHYNSKTNLAVHPYRYLVCNAAFSGLGQVRRLRHEKRNQPKRKSHMNSPQLQPFWAASFSFSRGHFVLTTPYDPHLAMIEREDEEISMAVRLFTHGYDNYAPTQNVCFNGQVSDYVHFVDQDEQDPAFTSRQEPSFKENASRYERDNAPSIARLLALIDMGSDEEWDRAKEEIYGTGSVRSTQKFFTCFGIHVESKITERKLCDFVSSGMMHNTFLDHLRIDGLGIDYNDFYFHFHELLRMHENN